MALVSQLDDDGPGLVVTDYTGERFVLNCNPKPVDDFISYRKYRKYRKAIELEPTCEFC